jgi:hypothetical protein
LIGCRSQHDSEPHGALVQKVLEWDNYINEFYIKETHLATSWSEEAKTEPAISSDIETRPNEPVETGAPDSDPSEMDINPSAFLQWAKFRFKKDAKNYRPKDDEEAEHERRLKSLSDAEQQAASRLLKSYIRS